MNSKQSKPKVQPKPFMAPTPTPAPAPAAMTAKPPSPAPAAPKAAPASRPALSKEQFVKEVEKRAHEVFLARGNKPGTALGDWLQAEKEVKEKYGIKD